MRAFEIIVCRPKVENNQTKTTTTKQTSVNVPAHSRICCLPQWLLPSFRGPGMQPEAAHASAHDLSHDHLGSFPSAVISSNKRAQDTETGSAGDSVHQIRLEGCNHRCYSHQLDASSFLTCVCHATIHARA